MQGKRPVPPPPSTYSQPNKRPNAPPPPTQIRSMPNPHAVNAAQRQGTSSYDSRPMHGSYGSPMVQQQSKLSQPLPMRELPRYGSQKGSTGASGVHAASKAPPPAAAEENVGIACSRLGSNYRMITCTIDTILSTSLPKGVIEIYGNVAEILSRPSGEERAWHFTVQDHTVPRTVLHVTYEPAADAEVTTGGTFRMIGNVAIGKEGKKLICVWLERMNDLREYQFTRELLAHPPLAEH